MLSTPQPQKQESPIQGYDFTIATPDYNNEEKNLLKKNRWNETQLFLVSTAFVLSDLHNRFGLYLGLAA